MSSTSTLYSSGGRQQTTAMMVSSQKKEKEKQSRNGSHFSLFPKGFLEGSQLSIGSYLRCGHPTPWSLDQPCVLLAQLPKISSLCPKISRSLQLGSFSRAGKTRTFLPVECTQ